MRNLGCRMAKEVASRPMLGTDGGERRRGRRKTEGGPPQGDRAGRAATVTGWGGRGDGGGPRKS